MLIFNTPKGCGHGINSTRKHVMADELRKRPLDPNQLRKLTVGIANGQIEEKVETKPVHKSK